MISSGIINVSLLEMPINITRPSGLKPLKESAIALYELVVASIISTPPESICPLFP